jgi:pseudaminic acid biosynthesis-associated methylase
MLTEQEQFWKGDFGDQYVGRHKELDWRARVPFWQFVLDLTKPRSILEVGCNAGGNMKAIREATKGGRLQALWGCDVNPTAIAEAGDAGLSVVNASLFDLATEWPVGKFDLTFTCGVLIHVAPEDQSRAMDQIIAVSGRYVVAVEYADDKEVEVEYRGNAKRLWRRPFGRLYQEKGLTLIEEFDAPADAFDRCRVWICERP